MVVDEIRRARLVEGLLPEFPERVEVVLPGLGRHDGVVQQAGLAGLVVLEVVPARRQVQHVAPFGRLIDVIYR